MPRTKINFKMIADTVRDGFISLEQAVKKFNQDVAYLTYTKNITYSGAKEDARNDVNDVRD
jgi:hypothetical protein